MDLTDEQRRALHQSMIDFMIQKRCILDSTVLKTWDIFRGIFTQFPFTPRQLLLEFHLRLLPNLTDYQINPYHVDYFEKLQTMSLKQRREYFEKDVAEIALCCPEGRDYPDEVHVTPRKQRRTSAYSVAKANEMRGYDADFMSDAKFYFSRFPSTHHYPGLNFLGCMDACWEIKQLLEYYPQQIVSHFLWFRMRMQAIDIYEIRKRNASTGRAQWLAKKKK